MREGYYLTPGHHKQFLDLLRDNPHGASMPGQFIGDTNYALVPYKCNAAVPAHGVMRVTGATLDSDNGARLDTAQPNATLQRFYLVNLGQDGEPDGLGNYYGAGTWLHHGGHVLYDTANVPAYGETWGPASGVWTITKNRWGFNIIGGNAGSGATSRTLAQQHIVNQLAGKPDASIASGSSGTVSVWAGTSGSEADTSLNVTAWCLGAAVIQGQWVKLNWIHGAWHIGPELTNEQFGKPDSNIAKGASGTVSIWNGAGGSEADSGINVTAWAKGTAVTSGKFVVLGNMNGVWYVAKWET